MIITQYFLKREIKNLTAKAAERPHKYLSFGDISKILFICHSKDWNVSRRCIEKLKSMNKNVNTAVYAPAEKDVPTWVSNYLLLRGDKDVNLWGYPSLSIQKQFLHLPADLIIDFVGEEALPMHYLFLKHSSVFKTGVKHSDNKVYDLSIIPAEENNNIPYLFNQIIDYLKTITSIQIPEEL
ncbi:MAG: hypothetical protein LBD80_01400 [Tannerella sp.]|jgi:hypothetical protein|nr:hypothetical protein [Tannerella sp.]